MKPDLNPITGLPIRVHDGYAQAESKLMASYRRWQQARAMSKARKLAERLKWTAQWRDATGCSWRTAWRRSGSLLFPCQPN